MNDSNDDSTPYNREASHRLTVKLAQQSLREAASRAEAAKSADKAHAHGQAPASVPAAEAQSSSPQE